ncbi:MAG: hypothetical protein PHH08_03955 [Candidatus ainarchaeum sp.]|nr:hypothetical protein [Candidatus ainarchaeum sp.]
MAKTNQAKETEPMHYYFSKNPFLKYYFYGSLKESAKLAQVKPGETVLDFGCNNKMLKKYLPECNYIGYDIDPKYSDVKDYTTVRPDTVFSVSVFEYLTEEELDSVAGDFIKMGAKQLITGQPTVNTIGKILSFLSGTYYKNKKEFRQYYRQTHEILGRHFDLAEETNFFFGMLRIARWVPKGKNRKKGKNEIQLP